MLKLRKLICTIVLILLSAITLPAQDMNLPVKNINGKDYYIYKVHAKETIYSITHKLKISKEDIIKYNPSVADGLRVHDTLYFPVAKEDSAKEQSDDAANTAYTVHIVKRGETIYGICKQYNITNETLFACNPNARDRLKTGAKLRIPQTQIAEPEEKEETATQEAEAESKQEIKEYIAISSVSDSLSQHFDTLNIAIMLPFMLEEPTPSKQAMLYTEFYKGFLIAVEQMKGKVESHISISTYDTADSLEVIKSLLENKNLKKSDIIIAPSNAEQIKFIGDFGKEHNCIVLNVFDVKNDNHTTNGKLLQANIPQAMMYDKAIKYFVKTYKNYRPVFLHNNDRRSDKAQFVNELKAGLDSCNIKYKEIRFSETLYEEDIESLRDTTLNYVFVPMSGNRSELASVITTISKFRERFSDPGKVTLFGYPEWTTFRGNILDRMHSFNTAIYSRFYNNSNSAESLLFDGEFKKWYGEEMLETTPAQGLLGYDTGMFILHSFNANDRKLNITTPYHGIQNGYEFISPDDIEGYINATLYLIKFNSNGSTDKSTLK